MAMPEEAFQRLKEVVDVLLGAGPRPAPGSLQELVRVYGVYHGLVSLGDADPEAVFLAGVAQTYIGELMARFEGPPEEAVRVAVLSRLFLFNLKGGGPRPDV